MSKQIAEKVILITGSSQGIGRSVALLAGGKGAKIVLNARSQDKLLEAEQELKNKGYEVLAVRADITKEEDCKRLIDSTVERFGKIDVLINNAGVSMRGSLEQISTEVIQRIYGVNTTGPLVLTRYAMPHIKASQGSVVFISSLAGLRGLPELSLYCSAKMALTAIAESMRIEHLADKVHIGLVYVGYTEVEAGKTAVGPNGEGIPLGERKGTFVQTTEEVAYSIIRHIEKRKRRSYLGVPGKAYGVISRHFPSLLEFLLRMAQRRMKAYAN